MGLGGRGLLLPQGQGQGQLELVLTLLEGWGRPCAEAALLEGRS